MTELKEFGVTTFPILHQKKRLFCSSFYLSFNAKLRHIQRYFIPNTNVTTKCNRKLMPIVKPHSIVTGSHLPIKLNHLPHTQNIVSVLVL